VIRQIHDRIVQIAQAKAWCKGAGCASTPPWLRAISTIRPTAVCWATGGPCADPQHAEDHAVDWRDGAKLRDRSRSVGWRLLEIARAARGKAPPSRDMMKRA
jgi:hypothetical protein